MNNIAHRYGLQSFGKPNLLCAALVLFMLTGPLVGSESTPWGRLLMYAVLSAVFITGPLSASRTRAELWVTCGLALLVLSSGLMSYLFADAAVIATAFGVLFFGLMARQVGRQLMEVNSEVNTQTLWTAINFYILIGLFFAFLYAAVAIYDHHAFVGKFMDQPLRDQLYGFVYFSFVTLTTLGYGDITPNNVVVGTFTYMEAIFGQLFIAIMVARLVGLYTTRQTMRG